MTEDRIITKGSTADTSWTALDRYLAAHRRPVDADEWQAMSVDALVAAIRRAASLLALPIEDMGPRDAQRLLRALHRAGLAKAERVAIVEAVRGFFHWCIMIGRHPGPNPLSAIRPPDAARLPRLTRDDEARLFAALAKVGQTRTKRPTSRTTPSKYALIFQLVASGALSVPEVLGLRKQDVLPDGVRLARSDGSQELVRLAPDLLAALRAFNAAHPAHDFVFYGEYGRSVTARQPLSTTAAYAIFDRARQRAGLPDDVTPLSLVYGPAHTPAFSARSAANAQWAFVDESEVADDERNPRVLDHRPPAPAGSDTASVT